MNETMNDLEGMLSGIREDQLEEFREVKVRLPVAHLIRLHGIKIVNGRSISDTIAEALTGYFHGLQEDARRQQDDAAPPPGPVADT